MGPPEGEEIEIGYRINASAWGRGIASKAVGDLLALLDNSPGVGRVVARTAVLNPASGRVLKSKRFVVVGRQDSPEGELLMWDRPE